MTLPRVPPLCRAAQLKQSVDIQLDRSFHEEQWTIAANLARQRHKSTKDDYYKVGACALPLFGRLIFPSI